MDYQKSELWGRSWALAAALAVLLVSTSASGQTGATDDESLRDAVVALESEEYERALELLDQAQPYEVDARVNYYRGFALEKLGECNAARRQYRMAATDKERARLQSIATSALDGFDARCTPAVKTVTEPVAVGSAANVGWQVFGWVTLTVGTLALVAVPVKNSIETSALEQATPYFEERYDCTVDRDGVSGAKCDRSGLEADSAYTDYRDRVDLADRTSTYLLIGGIATAGAGLAIILTDLLTGSSTASASVAPDTNGGFRANLRIEF